MSVYKARMLAPVICLSVLCLAWVVAASPQPTPGPEVEVVHAVLVDPWTNDSVRHHSPPDVPPEPLPDDPELPAVKQTSAALTLNQQPVPDSGDSLASPPSKSGDDAQDVDAEPGEDQWAAASAPAPARARTPRQTQLEALLLELTVRQMDTSENVSRLAAAAANASTALTRARTDIRRTASFVNGVTAAVERRLADLEADVAGLNASLSETLQTQRDFEQRWDVATDRIAELTTCCSAHSPPAASAPPSSEQLAELLAVQGVQQAEVSALRRQLARLRDGAAETRRRAAEAEAAQDARIRQLEAAVERLTRAALAPAESTDEEPAAGADTVQTLTLTSDDQPPPPPPPASAAQRTGETETEGNDGDLSVAGSTVSNQVVPPETEGDTTASRRVIISIDDLVRRDGAGGGTVVLGRSIQTGDRGSVRSGVTARIAPPPQMDRGGWRPLPSRSSRMLPPGALVSTRPAGVGSLSDLLKSGWTQPENAIEGIAQVQRSETTRADAATADHDGTLDLSAGLEANEIGPTDASSGVNVAEEGAEGQAVPLADSDNELAIEKEEEEQDSSSSSSEEASDELGNQEDVDAGGEEPEEPSDVNVLVNEILQQATLVKKQLKIYDNEEADAVEVEDQTAAATDVHEIVPVDNALTDDYQRRGVSARRLPPPPPSSLGNQQQIAHESRPQAQSTSRFNPAQRPVQQRHSSAQSSVSPQIQGRSLDLSPPSQDLSPPPVPHAGGQISPARHSSPSSVPRFQLSWASAAGPGAGAARGVGLGGAWRDPNLWCRPTQLYSRLDGMQFWCDVNCPVCPQTHCECFWHDGTGMDMQKLR